MGIYVYQSSPLSLSGPDRNQRGHRGIIFVVHITDDSTFDFLFCICMSDCVSRATFLVAGVQACRGSGKKLAENSRSGQNRIIAEGRSLQRCRTGAGRSAGSVETHLLTHHATNSTHTPDLTLSRMTMLMVIAADEGAYP